LGVGKKDKYGSVKGTSVDALPSGVPADDRIVLVHDIEVFQHYASLRVNASHVVGSYYARP
jgi:hypothetical protein